MIAAKNTICLWFDTDAEAAARFYAATFPDSAVTAVHHAPADYPSGKAGDVLTVQFTVCGIPCIGLNGGPAFPQTEAFSFQIATNDQDETDRYWNAIVGNGGQESACDWCKDRWGLSVDDVMQGEWRFWRETGDLWQVGQFRDGVKHGTWLRYGCDGTVEYRETFVQGKLRKGGA